MVKRPYIKKYEDIAGFEVWIVDGKFVRENLDMDFTNFGQHFRFKFIPKNEFWIDRENSKGEEKFFVSHLLVENRLMSKGKNWNTAITGADRIEKMERAKSRLMKKKIKLKDNHERLVKSAHKKLIKEYSNKKMKVWIVNGELVRDFFFIDFTEGGNDQIYHFIPKGEIWLDDDLSQKERKFVLLHEITERNLMKKGIGYGAQFLSKIWGKTKSHDSAHKSATEIEYYCRLHPKELEKNLKNEFGKVE